ncbi:hypothetical protein AAG906_019071 [Vitis piasezkii]
MSLSGAAQRWFASVEPSRLRTWEDVAHEFLTQFAFSADIDVSRRELEATRQRPEESISSFVTRWRAKVAGMVDRPKEQDQIDMVLRNLQPRFARPDPGEVGAISYQHRRPTHHPVYRPPTVRAPFSLPQYQYQLDYAQEPYIAQTSVQPRPPHPRAATHPPPDHMYRGREQFTPSSRRWSDCSFGARPLPHPIPPHFRSHEHCLYHQIPGHDTERCSALHHAIQDLIDSGVVDLARPSVTTNPLPTHSTHAVPPPPGLQLRTWFSRHGYITLQQFTSEHLFILIMVIIRVIFHFVESSFQFVRVVFILLSPVFGLGSFHDVRGCGQMMGGHHFMSLFTLSPSHIELPVRTHDIFYALHIMHEGSCGMTLHWGIAISEGVFIGDTVALLDTLHWDTLYSSTAGFEMTMLIDLLTRMHCFTLGACPSFGGRSDWFLTLEHLTSDMEIIGLFHVVLITYWGIATLLEVLTSRLDFLFVIACHDGLWSYRHLGFSLLGILG